MEEYTGVKFKTVIEEGSPGDVSGFLETDRMLGEYISPEGNEGNISIRTADGFLIKKAGARMTSLAENDVVLVKKIENGKVYAVGGTPSSESVMHYEVYRRRKDINIILHFHHELSVEWKSVGPFPYGSRELADAVADAMKDTDKVEIKEHGYVVAAENKERLFDIILSLFRRKGI